MHADVRVSADQLRDNWQAHLDESEQWSDGLLARAEVGAAEVKAKIAEYHRRWPVSL